MSDLNTKTTRNKHYQNPDRITVRSRPAAWSRTQRDKGNLQPGSPPNGGRGRQGQRSTAAGTETEHDHDC
eukprot:5460123-Prymnesium_polylepis.1